jgi:hypothetical protein
MTAKPGAVQQTLIDAMRESFDAALRSPEGVANPVALLWTDSDGQWRPLIPALRATLDQLFVLGPYQPSERTGPVIWLKCTVDRTLPGVAPPPDTIPILYLPGVSRQELRAAGDCRLELQPLIELQYRGAMWHQRNGRDWTVDAFLTSEYGLGLDVAQDARTREAMLRALPLLASEPIEALRGRRVQADDFDRLAIGDPIRDLLSWMSGPEAFQKRCDEARWRTFRDVCLREFSFDPEQDGPAVAGDSLLHAGGKWDEVWQRFCEAPRLYPGVSQLLRGPARDLFSDPSRRPTVNEEREDRLRLELEQVTSLPHAEACGRILTLDEEHKERRGWVWAQLGQSPLAIALEPLARLAQLGRWPLGGTSPQSVADDYAAQGWRCDRAALDALDSVRSPAESALVAKVVRTVYEPWLDKSARHFQSLVASGGVDARALVTGVTAEKDTCILFADGLRFDIAGLLQEELEGRGVRTRLSYRIAPLPTVTATAKPLASPAHGACEGGSNFDDFTPLLANSKQPVTAARLRDAMARQGVEVIDAHENRLWTKAESGGWTETGRLDELGHSLGAFVVRQIGTEVEAIAERVMGLLSAGWPRVRVVTDHGWLLLPGGLPKVELPPYLVATKWARCAAVRGESATDVPTFAWYWNAAARIASPPGIGSFIAGAEYAHGGVSVQECVVPELVVERGEAAVQARITGAQWRGMRCRVSVETNATGLRLDLRLNWKQPNTSIVAGVKEIAANGEGSIAVADDKHEGSAATLVVLDGAGQVLDYRATTVGEQS